MLILDLLSEVARLFTEKEKYIPNTKRALKYTAITFLVLFILLSILFIVAVIVFVR